MDKINVSVVSYLNSKPFVYGFQQSGLIDEINLQEDIPSICAKKLIENTVDIGLVPVAIIPQIKDAQIISDYCISANGKVASVVLCSNVPLQNIKKIVLDYQSRTSVELVKILVKHYWKINPEFEKAEPGFEDNISENIAAVIIGDRAFDAIKKYPHIYDLSEEWKKFTGKPFVFACWVANKKLPDDFLLKFNSALKYGIDNMAELLLLLEKSNAYKFDIKEYLSKNIQFELNADKKDALKLFLSYLQV